MTGDLRAAIRDAIDGAKCTNSGRCFREPRINPCIECLLDVIAATVETRLWRVANLNHGRCRYCGTDVDSGKPHRMYCRHYVGSLEHHWVGERFNGTFGGFDHECSCGRTVRVGGIAGTDGPPICPDADQDWRGPRPEERP